MTQDALRRALVLGGTGHIGNAIVRELLTRGVRVTVTSRRKVPTPNLRDLQIDFVTVGSTGPQAVGEHVADHDLVVDAAAPYPLRIFTRASYGHMPPEQFAALRSENLLAAVRRARCRLAVVSSFTTLPHPGSPVARLEARMIASLHPYFEVKRIIEDRVLAAARSGLRALLVNPTAVLGPWDCKPPDLSFLPLVLNGRLPFTTPRTVNVIDVRDVAAGLVSAVAGGCFAQRMLLSGHNVRLNDLVADACTLGKVETLRLPGSTRCGAGLALWGEVAWGRLLGIDCPIPSLPILLARYSYPVDPSSLQQQLAISLHPLAATLRDAIQWYASTGYLARVATGNETTPASGMAQVT